jgi:hypothetical protein
MIGQLGSPVVRTPLSQQDGSQTGGFKLIDDSLGHRIGN